MMIRLLLLTCLAGAGCAKVAPAPSPVMVSLPDQQFAWLVQINRDCYQFQGRQTAVYEHAECATIARKLRGTDR